MQTIKEISRYEISFLSYIYTYLFIQNKNITLDIVVSVNNDLLNYFLIYSYVKPNMKY